MIKLITPTILLGLLGLPAGAHTKEEIVKTIETEAVEAGIDPDFAVALATVESSLNPNAIGALGEVGLFQLRPEFHTVKRGMVKENVKVALGYLKSIRSQWEPKVGGAWFVMFNCGPNNPPRAFRETPKSTRYYRKVMRELGKIKAQRYLVAY